jgi:hypothetical protein
MLSREATNTKFIVFGLTRTGLEPTTYRTRLIFLFNFWCFKATFSNISAISWRPVLVVEKAGVPGENHQLWASNW